MADSKNNIPVLFFMGVGEYSIALFHAVSVTTRRKNTTAAFHFERHNTAAMLTFH
ncbi:hypothetical protein [Acidithiobacillus sp.]|uniref:hypothetical protein n=1 Tax=Acidithiobacillus sp. TaxID=1872118 RepID=UPI0035676A8C